MALTCGEQCLRILLVVCNLFVFLFGCICTGFAANTLANLKEYTNDQAALIVPASILALALLILVLGFLGCCGAWKLNSCCLKTYAIIISILIVIEIICGILIFVYQDKGKEFFTKVLREIIRNVEVSGNREMEATMLDLQEKGCADALYEYLKQHAIAAGVTAILLSVVEIGAVFAACCLAGKRSV